MYTGGCYYNYVLLYKVTLVRLYYMHIFKK